VVKFDLILDAGKELEASIQLDNRHDDETSIINFRSAAVTKEMIEKVIGSLGFLVCFQSLNLSYKLDTLVGHSLLAFLSSTHLQLVQG